MNKKGGNIIKLNNKEEKKIMENIYGDIINNFGFDEYSSQKQVLLKVKNKFKKQNIVYMKSKLGSGKTLMNTTLLNYYKQQGYITFLFTKNNLLYNYKKDYFNKLNQKKINNHKYNYDFISNFNYIKNFQLKDKGNGEKNAFMFSNIFKDFLKNIFLKESKIESFKQLNIKYFIKKNNHILLKIVKDIIKRKEIEEKIYNSISNPYIIIRIYTILETLKKTQKYINNSNFKKIDKKEYIENIILPGCFKSDLSGQFNSDPELLQNHLLKNFDSKLLFPNITNRNVLNSEVTEFSSIISKYILDSFNIFIEKKIKKTKILNIDKTIFYGNGNISIPEMFLFFYFGLSSNIYWKEKTNTKNNTYGKEKTNIKKNILLIVDDLYNLPSFFTLTLKLQSLGLNVKLLISGDYTFDPFEDILNFLNNKNFINFYKNSKFKKLEKSNAIKNFLKLTINNDSFQTNDNNNNDNNITKIFKQLKKFTNSYKKILRYCILSKNKNKKFNYLEYKDIKYYNLTENNSNVDNFNYFLNTNLISKKEYQELQQMNNDSSYFVNFNMINNERLQNKNNKDYNLVEIENEYNQKLKQLKQLISKEMKKNNIITINNKLFQKEKSKLSGKIKLNIEYININGDINSIIGQEWITIKEKINKIKDTLNNFLNEFNFLSNFDNEQNKDKKMKYLKLNKKIWEMNQKIKNIKYKNIIFQSISKKINKLNNVNKLIFPISNDDDNNNIYNEYSLLKNFKGSIVDIGNYINNKEHYKNHKIIFGKMNNITRGHNLQECNGFFLPSLLSYGDKLYSKTIENINQLLGRIDRIGVKDKTITIFFFYINPEEIKIINQLLSKELNKDIKKVNINKNINIKESTSNIIKEIYSSFSEMEKILIDIKEKTFSNIKNKEYKEIFYNIFTEIVNIHGKTKNFSESLGFKNQNFGKLLNNLKNDYNTFINL